LKIEPRPTPMSSRPLQRLSSSESWVASRTGWRNAIWMTAKPMRMRLVRMASAEANGMGSE
jgi:hypothetical protein